MRAGPAVMAAFCLCVTPVAAQGKTKTPKPPVALDVLAVCESFASANVLAGTAAETDGWDVTESEGESPFVTLTDAYKTFPGLGEVGLTIMIEAYPHVTFGYCRADLSEPQRDAGVREIDQLPEWSGSLKEGDDGAVYGSWEGRDAKQNHLLLSHQDDAYFVLQLTIINTHGAPAASPTP